MGIIAALASLLAVYTFGMEWYNEYKEQRYKSDFDEVIHEKNWSKYDRILKSLSSEEGLKDMYLFYAGYRELNKERSFSATPDPQFYLKQIEPLSEYFPRSILFRLTWINRKFEDEELIDNFNQLRNELEESGYFGPYYHLNEYLILKNSGFEEVSNSYRKFLSTYDFIKDDSYSVPVKVSINEGLINLTVYHQVAALNYLYLTNMIRYSDQKTEVDLAYKELSRLYSTQPALETTIIGLIELNLGTPEQLKTTIQIEALDFLGIEVDFNGFLTYAMNKWSFISPGYLGGNWEVRHKF